MLVKGTRWVKAWCVLLSDMLLLTRVEPSGHLSPLEAPLLLSDISAIETTLHRKYHQRTFFGIIATIFNDIFCCYLSDIVLCPFML